MIHSALMFGHILAGTVALVSGAAALTFRKGSRGHRKAGNAFVVSMLAMAGSGIYLAFVLPVMLSVVGGALTLYLVATAWAAGARGPGSSGRFAMAALVAALAIGAAAILFGIEALNSDTGLKDGFPAGGYFFFGSIALLAGSGDARLMLGRGIPGRQRTARHLWRMCFALFIASSAFFLGQAQLFPEFVRRSQVLLVPGYLPLLLLAYWLVRVLLQRGPVKPRSARPLTLPILVPLFISGLLSGCGESAGPTLDPVVRDSAGVMIHEFPAGVLERPASVRLAEAPSVRIGVVEGAPEYQWTRPVAAARLSDGGFAVLEQVPAEVRVFDRTGRFLHRIGGAGAGPGEFRSPVGLTILAGDTILVWDRGARRLTWFSTEGTPVRDRTLREPGGIRTVRHVALSPNGAVVVLGAMTTEEDLGNQGRVRETWQVVPLESGDSVATSLGTVPGTERAIQVQGSEAGQVVSVNVQGRWWWGEGFAWASGRGVWTADQLSFEVRHFDTERGLNRVVRVMADDRPFTRALIDSLHRVELDRVADPVIRELWRADFEERDYPPGVPPVAAVFGDAADRVWIGMMEPPPERLSLGELTAVRRWLMFEDDATVDGDGARLEFLGTLTLPPRSHPLWADTEGVLLVRVDSRWDLAYVEWYPYLDG